MSQTSQGQSSQHQDDATTLRLRRLIGPAWATMRKHRLTLDPSVSELPEDYTLEEIRLLGRLERDSIELYGIDRIKEGRLDELCDSFGLADFQIAAVLRDGAGCIGLFGPSGWADAPPVPVLAITPDGFDRSQVVPVPGIPGDVTSRLAFIVEILRVEGCCGPSTEKTITLKYTQMASGKTFEAAVFNPDPSGNDEWLLTDVSSPQRPSGEPGAEYEHNAVTPPTQAVSFLAERVELIDAAKASIGRPSPYEFTACWRRLRASWRGSSERAGTAS
jgi:hypothetical protein